MLVWVCSANIGGSSNGRTAAFEAVYEGPIPSPPANHLMDRIEKIKKKVDELYARTETNRADWADWLYHSHIFVVAENAKQLVKRFGGDSDIAVAASMLHDIADAVMPRENIEHKERSKKIANDFLRECNFSENEIGTIVNDAIEFHGCKNGELPKTLEGKIMATADALAHLKSNFYDYALEKFSKTDSAEDIKSWALPKIERDYRVKIFFDDVRQETRDDYERVKTLFQTLTS